MVQATNCNHASDWHPPHQNTRPHTLHSPPHLEDLAQLAPAVGSVEAGLEGVGVEPVSFVYFLF